MKSVLFLSLMMLGAGVSANEPAAAQQPAAGKTDEQALPVYTRLASEGNAEAQFLLGQMYWHGRGVPVDMAKGDALFHQAADGGFAAAGDALKMTARRQAVKADIDYFTSRYDGADLAGKFNCADPYIPVRSSSKGAITSVSADVQAWHACYNQFIGSYNALLPAGKAIPANIASLMTEAEFKRSVALMDFVYAEVAQDVQRKALMVMTAENEWAGKTADYVTGLNALTSQYYSHDYNLGNAYRATLADLQVGSPMPGQRKAQELTR